MSDLTLRRRAATLSISIGILLLVIKFIAFALTGSKAVLSDALESIINVIASGFAFYSILRSARPADVRYPYGYGNIEFFSAGFEGALIIVAAIAILWSAIPAFFRPTVLTQLDIALVLLVVGGLANYFLGFYLIRSGRTVHSDTLVADGHHVQTDAYTSFGVIIGLILVRITGWPWLDPLVACLMALNILVTGVRLLRESLAGLMHQSDPAFLRKVVAVLTERQDPAWIAPHHLRSWRSGALRFVDFHLVLPRYWQLDQSHEVQKDIESILTAATDEPNQLLIHCDPCAPAYCSICQMSNCSVRATPFLQRPTWTVETLMAGPPHPLLAH